MATFKFFFRQTLKIGFILLMITFYLPAEALGLRCNNHRVERGDRKIEVLNKCGAPTIVEEWQEDLTAYRVDGRRRERAGRKNTLHVEQWTYNFGPDSLIYFLTFINNKLDKIEPGERGHKAGEILLSDPGRCGSVVRRGERKIEVLRKCGEPYARESRVARRLVGKDSRTGGPLHEWAMGAALGSLLGGGDERRSRQETERYVNVEEWTYNFGPDQRLQFITFENGRVVDVDYGDQGF